MIKLSKEIRAVFAYSMGMALISPLLTLMFMVVFWQLGIYPIYAFYLTGGLGILCLLVGILLFMGYGKE